MMMLEDEHVNLDLISYLYFLIIDQISLSHSLQAFSKVVQKLVPQLPALENLLDILIQVCNLLSFHTSINFTMVMKIELLWLFLLPCI